MYHLAATPTACREEIASLSRSWAVETLQRKDRVLTIETFFTILQRFPQSLQGAGLQTNEEPCIPRMGLRSNLCCFMLLLEQSASPVDKSRWREEGYCLQGYPPRRGARART